MSEEIGREKGGKIKSRMLNGDGNKKGIKSIDLIGKNNKSAHFFF